MENETEEAAREAEFVTEARKLVDDVFERIGTDNVDTQRAIRNVMNDIVGKLIYERRKLRSEMADICNRAAEEIDGLRRQIGELAPKADAYERLSQVLDLLPRPSVGYGEDVAHKLRRRAQELRNDASRS